MPSMPKFFAAIAQLGLTAFAAHADVVLLGPDSRFQPQAALSAAPGSQGSVRPSGRRLSVTGSIAPGGWLSVRGALPAQLTPSILASTRAIEVVFSVKNEAVVVPRVTLADAVRGGGDELWWQTFGTVRGEGTYRLCALVSDFRLGFGKGARRNDGHFDLASLVAWELNFMPPPGGLHVQHVVAQIDQVTLRSHARCDAPG